MKALGVALAACCAAVLWPSAARANPIGPGLICFRRQLFA